MIFEKISIMTKRFLFYCNALMLLTSIHHVLGAYIYDTPWRLHILAFSIPVILLNIILNLKFRANKIAVYLLLAINFIITISLIGLFEGGYNHLVKNILFFSGTPAEVMVRLFPPPTYVMPGNFIFEFTGVLQAFLCVPLLYFFVKVVKNSFRMLGG